MADRRRVVITGIGPVTPVGTGVEDFWAGMTSGRNGVRHITAFDTTDLPVTVAGEVPDFAVDRYLDDKDMPAAREILRAAAFTYVAAAAMSLLNVARWIRVLRI